MVKIPDRFLGFAFSVGDILIEIDEDFRIIYADGAISEIGLSSKNNTDKTILDLLDDEEQATFNQLVQSLTSSNRIGPVKFSFGSTTNNKRTFAVFIGSLPHEPGRIFLVLMSSFRLGAYAHEEVENSNDGEPEAFLQKVENILSNNQGHDKNLNITLMEAVDGTPLDEKELDGLSNLLKKYSTGGNAAGRLNDNGFAIVHSKEPDGLSTKDLIAELTKSTGMSLTSTTIDADKNVISEEDGIRALIFSLQQFADKSEGFDMESLANGYDEIVEETATKVKRLRDILANGKFSLVYQPIVSLETREVHHSEALIRFNDPELHNLQFETICFAEKVGLIQEFDKATFNRAVEKITEIKKHSVPPKLAVNLSGRSLSDKGFLDNLKIRLNENLNLKDYISLEITESAEITNLEQLSFVITEIRAMGFKVYLDDFGAGAAGFRYLRELAVDGVKIDGDYVRDALVDSKIRAFLRSIVMLCNDLNIETIAEWVQTEEQADLLKSLGVTYAQGYLYGRPNAGIKAITS